MNALLMYVSMSDKGEDVLGGGEACEKCIKSRKARFKIKLNCAKRDYTFATTTKGESQRIQ